MARRSVPPGWGDGPVSSSTWLGVLALVTVVLFGVSTSTPGAPPRSPGVLGSGAAVPAPRMYGYASGPVQRIGTAAGRVHQVSAAVTRAVPAAGSVRGRPAPRPDLAPPSVGTRTPVRTGAVAMAPGRTLVNHQTVAASAATTGGLLDNAAYSVATVFDTAPMADQSGWIAVTLTNTGTSTWDVGYALEALVFPGSEPTGSGTPLASGTAVPVDVALAPGGTVTLESITPPELPGAYTVCWDMVSSARVLFSAEGGAEYCAPYTVAQYPAVIDEQEPLPGTDVDSQTPSLRASATVPGGYPATPVFTFAFQILNGPNPATAQVLQSSGWVADNGDSWSPPNPLAWGSTYYWRATVTDVSPPPILSTAAVTWTTPISFVVGNAQPAVLHRLGNAYQADDGNPVMTSDLGGADYSGSGRTVDPRNGNISEKATDATVATVGPALSIDRTYNSLDPRTSQAFGAGWSSLLDVSLVPDADGSGALVLSEADGRQVRFAKTATGGYAPPQDMYAAVTPLSGGGFSVTDQTGVTYRFSQANGAAWLISTITDGAGRAETFGYNSGALATVTNTTSGRALHLTWSTPTGATSAHVATVATDPVSASAPALIWTYGYHGDLLTSVCPPVSATACSRYGYATGASHAPTAVLNADPSSYYRLNEPAGTAAATNQIPVDDLSTLDPPATEMYTTAGVPGPVPGVTATGFNGTSSFIPLDGVWCTTPGQAGSCIPVSGSGRVVSSAATAVSVWFKTATASGVLIGLTSALPSSCGQTCLATTAMPLLWIGANGHLNGYGTCAGSLCTPLSSPVAVNNGAWHQAVLVPGQALYLDGAKVASGTATFPMPASADALLGAGLIPQNALYAQWSYFNGALADLSIYQNQLPSVGTVAAQYAAETQPAAELNSVTTPAGRTELAATYDTANDRVATLTDATGGTWTYGVPVPGASAAAYGDAVMASSPMDFWPFNDTAGPLAQDVVGATATAASPRPPASYLNVTLGMAGPTGFADGGAARFNGSTSQVSIPGGYFSGTGAESVELWFSTTATSGNLLSSHTGTGGEPLALWLSQGCLAGSVGSAVVGGPIFGACTTGSVADGKWHQAVLSVGPPVASAQGTATQAVTVYVDGAVVASTPVPAASTPAPAGYTVWVGNGPSGAFAGSIADLSLYSKKLTATEVTGHFNALHNQISVQLPSTNPFLPPSYLTTPIINDQTLTVTDPLGKSTTYLYVNRALTQITNPLGGVTSYGYDASGRASTVTDPAGDTTYTTFDAHNNVTSVTTCAVVNSCQTSYAGYFENLSNPLDPRNDKPTDQRDPRSSSPYDPAYDTVTGYTPAGEVAFRKSPPTTACPSGCRRSYAYSTGTEAAIGGGTQPAGLLASSTAPGGAVTSYAYDSAGDVMQVTDPAGLVTRYTYDSLGRELTQTQISDSYPGGLTDSYTYDGLDRPVTQSDAPVTDRVTGAVHTKTSNFTYDPDSGVLTATVSDPTGGDPSRTVTNTYNAHGELASVTDPRGNTITYTYDALGDRASETDPAGVTTVYTYDSAGDLLTATLRGYTGDPGSPSPPTDLVLQSRSYDPAGRLASATNVKGTTAYYTYYGNNQLASTAVVATGSTARQQVTTYAYDPAGNLTTETDPGGLVTTTVYNAAGQVVSQAQDPGGANRTVTAGYDADGDVVAASTTRGSVTRNVTATYDAMDRVLSRTVEDGAGGLTTTVTRDRRGLPISVTDPAGNTTLIANDEVGRPVVVTGTPVPTQAGPGAPVIARPVTMTGYDTYSDHVEYADANGNVTTATYDTDGLLVSVTDPTYTPPGATAPVNGTSTFAYNGLGQQTKATDPLGRTTTTSYDQLGNMCGQIDPSGGVWTYTYDPAGEQTSVTDPTGARTQATYDGFGHLVTTTNLVRQNGSAAYTTSYAYNDAGEQVSRTTPTGEKTAAAYNALGELTSVTDPAGDTATFTWNLYGSLAKATLPDGSGLTESYDPAGRPLSLSELDGTGTVLRTASVGYDANGDVTSATDFRGTTSTATYDASGALLSVTQPVSAGQSVTTRYGYDLAGNRTALTGGNGNTTYTTYNSLGLPETTVEPPTAAHGSVADSTTTGSYNADGELVTQYLPGGVQVNNTYDAMGALTSQSGTGASAPTATRTFSYDAAGRLLTAASGAAGTPGTFGYQQATIESFTYDDRGLLLSASGAAGTSTFGYDAAGRLATATDAAGTSTYTYDSAGRLATDADAASGITGTYGYNTLDQLVRISYGTGNNSRSFGYDSLHRLASDTVTTAGGAQVARIGYGYNGNDDLTTVTTSGLAAPGGTGTVANTYGYDQSDRLTSWTASPASGSPTTRTYGYDADGNLVNNNGVAQTYDARDELVSDGNGNTYSYTADGDLLNQVSPGPGGTTTWTSSSDAYGQQSTGGSASSYTYDALGRLVSVGKLLDNTYAIPLTYDGMTDNVASDTSARYSRDPTGDLVGVATSGGGRLLALSNRHGDVSGLFTATGSGLTGSTTYDPWGGVLATTGPTIQLGYQGQWTDPVTQQVDMGARFYRPRTGGFANQDTYTNGEGGAAVTDNPHAYADDNPLSVADPTGHSPSNGGGTNGTITLADVQAAQARAASAEHRAASAESAARTAWSVAASAGRAASADAAEARALNSEAASLLREYNSVSGQANAAFADARREASIAAQDRLEADSLKAQEYTTVPVYSTRLVAVGGASTSTSIKCGVGIGPAVGDTLTLTGGCQVTGGSGGSIQFEAVTVQTGTKKVKNQAIADRIAALERAADAAARESDRDTNRGMGLTWKAIGIYAQYETTREEAAVAAGRAAEAASYAIQTRQRAQYLSQVAASDEAAAHKAEAEYRACERKYQQEQRQEKHRAKPHKHGPEHLKNPPAPRSPRVTRTPPAPRLPHVTKTPPAPPLTLTTVTPPAPRLPLTTATPPVSHGVTVNADSGDDENAGEESPEDDGFDPDDPNDDLGAAARSARDERGKGGKRGAYIGGYDPATGDVATGESGPDGCAENACEEELGGGPAQPKFTKAFGWRKGVWREIPTCIRCQGRYSREQFPPDVTFDPGGPWSQ